MLIRIGCFETNSSSSHSLTVGSAQLVPFILDLPESSEGVILVGGHEFGWGPERYNDAATKISYCYLFAKDTGDETILRDVVRKATGCELQESECQGYIDHNSSDTGKNAFSSEEKLYNFLFNKNSWLFIANDNSDERSLQYVPTYTVDGEVPFKEQAKLYVDGAYVGKLPLLDDSSALEDLLNKHLDNRVDLPYGTTDNLEFNKPFAVLKRNKQEHQNNDWKYLSNNPQLRVNTNKVYTCILLPNV